MTDADVLEVLQAIHYKRRYALRPTNEALVLANRSGLVRPLHREACLHVVGTDLEIWKDLALTPEGLDALHAALLGP